jgi:hypothetical protein
MPRWECRYSPSEMMYLEVTATDDVRAYLDHNPGGADVWSFDRVLRGEADGFIRSLFGESALAGVKAEVTARVEDRVRGAERPPQPS